MAQIGVINIGMQVATGGLLKGLKTATGGLSSFAASAKSKIGSVVDGFARIGLAAQGLSTVWNLGKSMITNYAEAADTLADMAARTGVAGSTLSELGAVANTTGASIEVVEAAFKKQSKTIYEATTGSKSAAAAFSAIGLSATSLAAMQPEQQFMAIADALSKVTDPTMQAGMAMDIFGKNGTQLLPMMKDGAKGLQEMRDRARDLGLTMSDEAVTAGGDLADTLTELGTSVKMVTVHIGAALAPAVQALAPVFMENAKVIGDYVKTVVYHFTHLKDYIELASLKSTLAVVTFANQVSYFFTEVIPGVAVWLAGNWKDILHDMWEFTSTMFSNLAKNIVKIIKNVPGLIRGSVSFADLWTPLLDGAEFALKGLPDIPERVMGDFEKALGEDITRIGKKVDKDWQEFTNPAKVAPKAKPATGGASPLMGGLWDLWGKATTGVGNMLKNLPALPAVAKPQETRFADLAEAGSKEARSSIMRWQYGGQDSGIKGLAQTGKDHLKESKDQTRLLATIAANTEADSDEFDF